MDRDELVALLVSEFGGDEAESLEQAQEVADILENAGLLASLAAPTPDPTKCPDCGLSWQPYPDALEENARLVIDAMRAEVEKHGDDDDLSAVVELIEARLAAIAAIDRLASRSPAGSVLSEEEPSRD